MSKSRISIEYIHPSKRDLTVPKGLWDFVSYSNRWRHARVLITKKPVPFISGDVEGYVYDAGKDHTSRLVPIYEKFQASSFNRYLAIGNLKDGMSDEDVKAFCKCTLTVILVGHPLLSLKSRGC